MRHKTSLDRGPISRRTMLATTVAMAASPALAEECRVGPPPHHKGPLVFMDYDQVELAVGEGYNHFEMLETLGNPYGLLGRAVFAQMRLTRE